MTLPRAGRCSPGCILIPIAVLAYVSMQRRRRREAAGVRQPGADAQPRHRAARLAPPPAAAAAAGRARRAGGRARAAAAHGRRAAARGDGDDGHRHLGLDERQRRRARPAVRGRQGRAPAHRQAARAVPPRPRHVLRLRRGAGAADDRPRRRSRPALDRLRAEGGTAMATGLQRALELARTPVPNEDGTGTRRLPAVLVLLSDGKDTQSSISPLEVARQAEELKIPIFAIALGTPRARSTVRDQFGSLRHILVPPDTETLREIAEITGGALLRGAGRRTARVDLRQPRHPALLQAGRARGHVRLRRRRDRAAAGRRRPLADVVRPPVVTGSPPGGTKP